jgi:crotonobetainyl-CoA:carnitine CoA-transferase CaiB-like acyl-CoA transferase
MNEPSETSSLGAGSNLPLTGLLVVDVAIGPLAAIGRHLAELGADVIRVEPPAGGLDRKEGRLAAGISIEFVAANRGKRAVALDLSQSAGRTSFDALLAAADILIENTGPGSEAETNLNVAEISAKNPTLVILSASNFGRKGSYRQWQATTPVLHALSGELSRSGMPDRPPLLPPGDLAFDCAIVQAVFVILTAYLNRLRRGRGDHLDFSVLDAACQALDPGYGISGSATAGMPPNQLPRGRAEARHQYPIIRCVDGYVRLCILAPRQWQGMFEWMGKPEEFSDPSYALLQTRFASKTLIPAISRFFSDKKRAELEEAGQCYGVPTAALLDLDEALNSDHVKARKFLDSIEIAPGIIAPFPAAIMEIDGLRTSPGPAPALGEHNDEVFAEIDKRQPSASTLIGWGDRPLGGLRVLDFGVIVVGAEQGRLLADQGADVIKIENTAFPDGSRQNRMGGSISITFAAGHRNKRSLGLNVRDPKGKALLLDLIKKRMSFYPISSQELSNRSAWIMRP